MDRDQESRLTDSIQLWFHHRRLQQKTAVNPESVKTREYIAEATASSQAPTPPPKHSKDIDDDSKFGDRKAHLVSSLATGLEKMREASSTGGSATPSNSNPRLAVRDKLGEFPSLEYEDYDEYDEIDPREASQSPGSSGAGRSGVSLGKAAVPTTPNTDMNNLNVPAHSFRRSGHEDHGHSHEQGQGKHRTGLWRRLRSNSGK